MMFEKSKHVPDGNSKVWLYFSTEYGLALLYDRISSAIDSNEVTVGIFIDLSKAFDSVNHQILLDKLQYYGIRGIAFDWFSDYLKNSQQFVHFNGCRSSHHFIKCGVPQGSILGPLLFLIYIRGTQRICSSLYLFPRGILLAGKNTGVPMSWLGNLLLIEVLPGNY